MLVRGAAFPLGLVSSILLARYLGITQLGVYSEAFAWGSVVAILGTAGLDRLAVREISSHSAKGSWGSVRGHISRLPRYTVVSSLIVALVAILLVLLLKGTGEDEGFRTFAIAIAMAPVMSLAILRQGMLQGLGQVVFSRLPEDVIRPAVFIVALFAVFGLGGASADSELAMALQAGALLVAFVFGIYLLRRGTPAEIERAVREPLPDRLIRGALPLGLFAGMSILMVQIDVILVGLISDPDQVGLYATAYKVAIIVSLAEFAVDNAFQPMASAMISGGETGRLRRASPRAGLAALLLALPIAIPLIALAEPVLSVFGSEFTSGVDTLRILSASFVLSLLFGQNGTLLMMSRNMRPLVISTAAALVVNVALNLALVPGMGAEGAAVSWLVTVLVWNLLLAVQVRRIFGFSASPLVLLRRAGRAG